MTVECFSIDLVSWKISGDFGLTTSFRIPPPYVPLKHEIRLHLVAGEWILFLPNLFFANMSLLFLGSFSFHVESHCMCHCLHRCHLLRFFQCRTNRNGFLALEIRWDYILVVPFEFARGKRPFSFVEGNLSEAKNCTAKNVSLSRNARLQGIGPDLLS